MLRGRDRHELFDAVEQSVAEGFRSADDYLRSRRVSHRGSRLAELITSWTYEDFRDGRITQLDPGEVDNYLLWLDEATPRWIKDAVGGLPVTQEAMRLAEEYAPEWVGPLRLMPVRESE